MLGNTNAMSSSQSLSISINGTNKLTYNGKNTTSLDISLSSLGAAPSNHNHDAVYAKISHNHDSKYFRLNLGTTDKDFNTILTDGRYNGAVQKRANSPYPNTTIYGELDVRVSGGGTHNNLSNWIWQTFYITERTALFFRGKTNASPWRDWIVIAYQNSGPACMQSASPGDTRILWAW